MTRRRALREVHVVLHGTHNCHGVTSVVSTATGSHLRRGLCQVSLDSSAMILARCGLNSDPRCNTARVHKPLGMEKPAIQSNTLSARSMPFVAKGVEHHVVSGKLDPAFCQPLAFDHFGNHADVSTIRYDVPCRHVTEIRQSKDQHPHCYTMAHCPAKLVHNL